MNKAMPYRLRRRTGGETRGLSLMVYTSLRLLSDKVRMLKVISCTLIFFGVASLSACTTTVSRTELLNGMNSQVSVKSSHINILWYEGTKNHFHYVSHVYKMFGTQKYRISDSELYIPEGEVIPLTSDSTKWKRVGRISDEWVASRKDFDSGLWEPEPEGIALTK